jgi:hypothetical protein
LVTARGYSIILWPGAPPAPVWKEVDIQGVRVEWAREFGAVYLALALWRVLEMWMHGKGLGKCALQLVSEVATIKSMDVVLPVRTAKGTTDLRLRVVSKPDRMVAELLQRLGLQLPTRSKIVENVVEKTGVL